ncbi:YidC/Oxa1 family membrane protein insertase [Lacrimispora algidixylanolytica]|uniref:Preprotein translocase YidC n=1 Tax=Lacrimispora algidixylanolytica TaxID=94868 RepID=A0A419TD24_9FIRM|nr:YidC/Oxa1 family membrane protein insertase [Lacrimispora algidixylanolytica]RKD35347.1 preprotein translocase YidC [Lacrimispora algidixylanolytica]
MEFLVLTKVGGILGPFATVLGVIMDWLFQLTSTFGIQNIGLCIILFTLVTKLLMFPLTLKQQKSSKLMSVMQPEIQAVQAKYKGKTDQESMRKQNVEVQAVYEKYGTSMTGGCLQLVIQMPILFALYQVIYQIPAYVPSVKRLFENVVNAIGSLNVNHVEQLKQFATDNKVNITRVHDMSTNNGMVDFLYQLNPMQWGQLQNLFPSVKDVIASNADKIAQMNSFLGINLASTPSSVIFPAGGGFHFSLALLIPVMAGASQWFSARLMTVNQTQTQKPGDEGNAMAQSMKMMNTVMPLMSVFFCFTFPAGIGIYWIASSVFQILQQLAVNRYLNRIDMDEMIKKNVDKANKKRAKKGLPPQRVSQNATANLKNLQAANEVEEADMDAKKEKIKEQVKASNDFYNKDSSNPSSISSKARMVSKYNDKQK